MNSSIAKNINNSPNIKNNIKQMNDFQYKNEFKPKVWYTQYRGYIVKSVLDHNNRIHEEKIPFNQPSSFRNFLNNYFLNELN
jgi:uncharacterized membrane protein YheB (UPF0754 family)